MTRYLTDYSVMHAELTVEPMAGVDRAPDYEIQRRLCPKRAREDPDVGYPEAWLRRVLRERPDQFRLPVEQPPPKATQ